MQSNDESQVCAISLVDLTAEEVGDECSDRLIETPSLCESKEGTQVIINPALSQKEQNKVCLLVIIVFRNIFGETRADNSDGV